MTYNIFCLHSRYNDSVQTDFDCIASNYRFNYEMISKWMGDNNKTVYITMIRDPVDIFVSAWDYYKLIGNYKMTLGRNHDS